MMVFRLEPIGCIVTVIVLLIIEDRRRSAGFAPDIEFGLSPPLLKTGYMQGSI
jgi:hypothetical protein